MRPLARWMMVLSVIALALPSRAAVVGPELAFPAGGASAVVPWPDGWFVVMRDGSCVNVAWDGTAVVRGSLPVAREVAIAFDGIAGFVLAWPEGDAVRVAWVDGACTLGPSGIVTLPMPTTCDEYPTTECEHGQQTPGAVGEVALAANGDEVTAAWSRQITYRDEVSELIYAVRFPYWLDPLPAPRKLAQFPFARLGHHQHVSSLDVASSSSAVAVAASIGQYTTTSTFGALLDESWNVLARIDRKELEGPQLLRLEPSLDSDGVTFLLARTAVSATAEGPCPMPFSPAASAITTRQVGPFGGPSVVLPDPTGPCPSPTVPTRVTYDGLHHFVWWAGGYQYVGADGVPLDPSPLAFPSDAEALISFGKDGRGLLVTSTAARLVTTWMRLAVGAGGNGAGTVVSSPAGISCPPACQAIFLAEPPVTLTALPDASSRFAFWDGDGVCAGQGPTCVMAPEPMRDPNLDFAFASFANAVPPVLAVPADARLVATSPGGARYAFTATATDDLLGALVPTCSPPSGSLFPLGVTQVTCAATDTDGNTGEASFRVTVQLPCLRFPPGHWHWPWHGPRHGPHPHW